MISFQRHQQVALPLGRISDVFRSLRALVSSAAARRSPMTLGPQMKRHAAEHEPSLRTDGAAVSPTKPRSTLQQPVGGGSMPMTTTPRSKEPPPGGVVLPVARRATSHVSADTFFQNKHGFSLGTWGLYGQRRAPQRSAAFLSELCRPPVWIVQQQQTRGFKTLSSPSSWTGRLVSRRRSETEKSGLGREATAPKDIPEVPRNVPDSQMEGFKTGFTEGFLKFQELSRAQARRFWLILLANVTLVGYGLYSLVSSGAVQFQLSDYEADASVAMSGVTFDDVRGADEAKAELQNVVHFLRNPRQFTHLGGKLPKGILLVGPPGTGKTLLARAVAGEAGVPFFYASGSEFEEVFAGLGASRVRKLFGRAKAQSPCVIFIDELDSVGGERVNSPAEPSHARQTINQLLAEMDGFVPNEGVVVIGATNMAELLDKALVRPGRFDVRVAVPFPDVAGRADILDWYLSKVKADPAVDPRVLARGTPGFSGADLESLVNQAALHAAGLGQPSVTSADLEFAKDKILMGPERRSARVDARTRAVTACHEAGHAVVALYTRHATPVHKATIVPRGDSLGHVATLAADDRWLQTRAELLADMDVCMGGRAAEELLFGRDAVTTGAASDFDGATRIAELMVTRFGMGSDAIGLATGPADPALQSPERRAAVEREVAALLGDSYKRARSVLTAHGEEHKALAEALLAYETLDAKQIQALLRGRL